MARREKIILAVMAIVVVIGGYDLLFNPSSKSDPVIQQDSVTELTDFVTGVVSAVKQKDTKSDYIITLASLDWANDPFLKFDPAVASKIDSRAGRTSESGVTLTYSGYLQMGRKALAVINGIEYEEGEALDKGEYLIEKISPASVVLRSSGKTDSITLFLDEAY